MSFQLFAFLSTIYYHFLSPFTKTIIRYYIQKIFKNKYINLNHINYIGLNNLNTYFLNPSKAATANITSNNLPAKLKDINQVSIAVNIFIPPKYSLLILLNIHHYFYFYLSWLDILT